MAKSVKPIRWTVELAASEFQVDRRTLANRIKAEGIIPGEDGKFSTKQICAAAFRDIDAEKFRTARAEADIRERERDETFKRAIPFPLVALAWNAISANLRAGIMGAKLPRKVKVDLVKRLRELKPGDYFKYSKAADVEEDEQES